MTPEREEAYRLLTRYGWAGAVIEASRRERLEGRYWGQVLRELRRIRRLTRRVRNPVPA